MSQVLGARSVGSCARTAEHFTQILQQWRNDVLEDVSFGYDHGSGSNVKCVPGAGVPVIIYRVQKGIANHLWSAAGGVVDVVSFEGNEIVGAGEVEGPVVVVITCRRPGGWAVEFGVRDRDTAWCGRAGYEELSSNERDFDVINPNEISARKSDRISSPDVLWIELGDAYVSA